MFQNSENLFFKYSSNDLFENLFHTLKVLKLDWKQTKCAQNSIAFGKSLIYYS